MLATKIGQCAVKNGSAVSKGTYGSVYKCRLEDTEEGNINVAVKEYMLPIQRNDPDATAMVEEALSTLLEEMDLSLIPLTPHPNICRYYGIEYIPGMIHGNLDRVLLTCDWIDHSKKLKGPLPEEDVKHIAKGMLKALAHLHAEGLSHDDLRPCNIITTLVWNRYEEGADKKLAHPVLTDYSIFKKILNIIDPMGGGATTKQKPAYCAPEVFTDGKDYESSKCDIWSLAACVLELLAGKPPFHEMDPSGKGNVMFKIIQSRKPPEYPKDISDACKLYLDTSFNRDHMTRATAINLLDMEWFK